MSKKDKKKTKKKEDLFEEKKPVEETEEEEEETEEEDEEETEEEEEEVVNLGESEKAMVAALAKNSPFEVIAIKGGFAVARTSGEIVREYLAEEVKNPKSCAISYAFKLLKKLHEQQA